MRSSKGLRGKGEYDHLSRPTTSDRFLNSETRLSPLRTNYRNLYAATCISPCCETKNHQSQAGGDVLHVGRRPFDQSNDDPAPSVKLPL